MKLIPFVTAFAFTTFVSAHAQDQFVKVSGRGEAHRMPDYALVTVGVSHVDSSTDSALRFVERGARGLLIMCSQFGIDSTKIHTRDFDLTREYKYDRKSGEEQYIGLKALTTYEVRIDNVARVDSFLAKCIALGTNEVKRVLFYSSNEDSLRKAALDGAILAARENAKAIATPMGRKVGKLLMATDEDAARHDVTKESPSLTWGQIQRPDLVTNASIPAYEPVFIKVIPQEVWVYVTVYAVFGLQ